jgi:hypothetical protein
MAALRSARTFREEVDVATNVSVYTGLKERERVVGQGRRAGFVSQERRADAAVHVREIASGRTVGTGRIARGSTH